MIQHICKYIGSRFYLAIIVTLIISLLEIFMISLMSPIMTNLSDGSPLSIKVFGLNFEIGLVEYLYCLVVLGLMIGAASYMQGRLISRMRSEYEYNIRSNIFRKIISSKWRYSSEYKKSYIYSSITEEVNRNSMVIHYLFSICSLSSLIVLYLIAASIISIEFTLITLGIFCFIFLLMKSFISKSKNIGIEMNDTNDKFFDAVNEYIANIRYIKQNKIEAYVTGMYLNSLKKLKGLRYQGVLKSFSIKSLYDPMMVTVISIMVYSAEQLKLDMGQFVVLLVIVYRLSPRTSQLQRDYHELLLYLPSIGKVEQLIENRNLDKKIKPNLKTSNCKSLIVKNLWFTYGRFELSIDHFCADPSSVTTIIGKSGSGKTTFVDILSGIRDDYKGDVLYPDDISNLNSIEYVTQDSVLFSVSVLENIKLDADIPLGKIINVCKTLGIDDFVETLPGGYHHLVKNGGGEFSGGQKQRLMLARALVREPKILILDESTSALDNYAEREFLALIHDIKAKLNLIVIMIAHRTTTILESDMIYMLEDGKFVVGGKKSEAILNNKVASLIKDNK